MTQSSGDMQMHVLGAFSHSLALVFDLSVSITCIPGAFPCGLPAAYVEYGLAEHDEKLGVPSTCACP